MHAPGRPGIAPTWTSSAKDAVGCALGSPRLWFSTGFGIVNEVYWPRADIPQIRDLGFVVADDRGFWVEVKRNGCYRTAQPGPGIPAFEITHEHARFELRVRVAPDPTRDVLLVEVDLAAQDELRIYALIAPHLGGGGRDNRAAVDRYNGRRVMWAEKGPFAMALAAADGAQQDAWGACSAGYVGVSDGWQDFSRNGRMTWSFGVAGPGNVALIGELPARAALALAFASSKESAATLAFGALTVPFSEAWQRHVGAWRRWTGKLRLPRGLPEVIQDELATSAMVLRVQQDKTYPGAIVASMSVPWGNSRDDTGGYHLVWPRDLVESAGGLLALGATDDARSVLRYLIATQREDGHWPQNQWLGGKPYWSGVQLDETGFPVLLAAALAQTEALDGIEVRPMVRSALSFIARTGPASDQDRWEEDAGINSFTLAVCIAALVCGADFLDEPARSLALSIADHWNARIEDWATARGTRVGQAVGVETHYVRVAPPAYAGDAGGLGRVLPIKNRRRDPGLPAQEQIGTDFLQLVRFGLRAPDDPVVLASIKVVDSQLKVDTPNGAAWRRYTGDGYGEHADGAPFDGTGVGRAWPLLVGERGHYELAAGRDPLPFLQTMAAMTGPGGLIPEQVWDGEPDRLRNLYPGRPSGSAMPLAWAHAEFVKLAASRVIGRPLDEPQAVRRRYGGRRPDPRHVLWMRHFPVDTIRRGKVLRICLPAPAIVHWGVDGWKSVTDTRTRDSGLGVHSADVPCRCSFAGQGIDFTFLWTQSGRWEGRDYHVSVS
ncbi:MAG: glycosyl hydrolase [Betaproteobacteria bacterium]|nr:MAG: glycosyl hydrolase [Betaproteobacteria bacterium]